MRRSSPRKRAREADADACCAFGAATRARHALEAESQQPAVQQPQPETSSDEDSCSTASTETCGDKVAPILAAAPAKRKILRHFETALLHSTSAALTAEKEKVVATLTAAGESRLSNAHGVFLEQHCANATREECAFVDGCLRLWFTAGTGGDFKELFDMLEKHGKLTLSEALAREECAANEPFGQDWCEIFVPLRILITLRRMKVLPAGGCVVCDTSDVAVGGRVLPCSHRVCGGCFPKLHKTAVLADGRAAPRCPLCRRACPKTTGWHAAPAPGAALLAGAL